MVGSGEGAGLPVLGLGAPPAAAVAEPVQAALVIEARLLDGLFAALARQAALRTVPQQAQARGGPGLLRAVPFHPGDTCRVGTGCRCGVEVRAFGDDLARTVGVQAHDAVDHGIALAAFLHRQQRVPSRHVVQVAIAALRARGQLPGRLVEAQPAHLLVALLHPGHALGRGAAGAAAVFVDTAARRGAGRRQFLQRAVAPQVQAAARAARLELQPQQPAVGRVQFGEVAPRRHRALGAPGAGPVAMGQAAHPQALQISCEARWLRQVSWSRPSGASSAWRRASRIFPWWADLAHTGSVASASPVSM